LISYPSNDHMMMKYHPVTAPWTSLLILGAFILNPVVSYGDEVELNRLSEEVQALHQQGKYPEMIAMSEKRLELIIRLRGNDHIDTAASIAWLAFQYVIQGRHEEAEPLFHRSLEICEKQPGGGSPRHSESPV